MFESVANFDPRAILYPTTYFTMVSERPTFDQLVDILMAAGMKEPSANYLAAGAIWRASQRHMFSGEGCKIAVESLKSGCLWWVDLMALPSPYCYNPSCSKFTLCVHILAVYLQKFYDIRWLMQLITTLRRRKLMPTPELTDEVRQALVPKTGVNGVGRKPGTRKRKRKVERTSPRKMVSDIASIINEQPLPLTIEDATADVDDAEEGDEEEGQEEGEDDDIYEAYREDELQLSDEESLHTIWSWEVFRDCRAGKFCQACAQGIPTKGTYVCGWVERTDLRTYLCNSPACILSRKEFKHGTSKLIDATGVFPAAVDKYVDAQKKLPK
jgi:hypothetical protein